jgi:glycine/D-amino acid oxidase-like deaminating enzyme
MSTEDIGQGVVVGTEDGRRIRAEFAVVATNSPIKTGEADDGNVRFEGFEGFEGWTRNPIPDLGRETHRWSGQVLEPVHHTAFIGRNPGSEKVFIVTGDSGQGITHGVVGSFDDFR